MSAPRRNGLPSSCEPCRKSKLRCDHATPCGRCRRRKRSAQCIYHPAPMTKRMSPERICSPEPVNRPLLPSTRPTLPSPGDSWTGNSNKTPSNHGELCFEGPLRAKLLADWCKKTASSPGIGVLGPTSYSAVYDESEDVIKSSATSFQDYSKSLRKNLTTVDDAQIQLGAELLLFLYDDLTLYERMGLAKLHHCEGYVFAPSVLRLLFASVRHMLNATIEDRSNPLPDLFKLSERIFENCSKPIHVDAHMTPQDFFISMPNKWEVIGVLFSIIGASACTLPISYHVSMGLKPANLEPKDLALVCIAAGDKCIKFCESAGTMSEPLAWALLAHASLLTLVYGDYGKHDQKVVNIYLIYSNSYI
jgi:chromatin structure-remodeling complex subunit RSC3/30